MDPALLPVAFPPPNRAFCRSACHAPAPCACGQVKVKRRGSDSKYVAQVLAMGVECDIALLTGGWVGAAVAWF